MSELEHKHQSYIAFEPTIHDLRKLGWKVRVIHGDITPDNDAEYDPKVIGLATKFTKIELRSPEGIEYSGIAYCSKQDNYNRKLGNKIALGRALKKAMLEINPA